MKTKILFVINPTSGTQNKVDFAALISQSAAELEFDFRIYKTTGKDDRNEVRKLLDQYEPETVIAVGGDGTIGMVASEIINTDTKLGVIPNGSANGMAYNLNIPNDFKQALHINLTGSYKPIDAIEINKKYYCLHLSDIGLNARIVKRFEREGSKGMLGYAKHLFKEMFSPKSTFSFVVQSNRFRKHSRAEMLVVANAQSYGTGVKINPTGKLDDGWFEIVAIKPYPWWFLFTFIYSGFRGTLNRRRFVTVWKVKNAVIRMKHDQDFQIDGEVVDDAKMVEVKILPNALMIIHN